MAQSAAATADTISIQSMASSAPIPTIIESNSAHMHDKCMF